MWRWLALTGLGLTVIVAFSLREKIAYRLPVPDSRLSIASDGVNENAEWHPTIHRFDGANMALVPAGCFIMGSTSEQLGEALDSCDRYYGAWGCQQDFEDEQPAHEVCFEKPFWIDVTEVTNRAYGSSSRESMYRAPRWPRETVNWAEASAYCEQRGARLPSEAEWEYVARGPDSLIYPWGNEFDTNHVIWFTLKPYNVGGKDEGASWVGALDMSGSISEWVADSYGSYSTEAQIDPTGPAGGEERITRGGDWFSHAAYFLRTSHRAPYDPEFASSVVGFRCARDFE
jgi:iron(II)-dependent oxidoreductase